VDNSITFLVLRQPEGTLLAEVTLSRDLDLKINGGEEKKAPVEHALKSIFADGVYVLQHSSDIKDGVRIWVKRSLSRDAPNFFEAAVAMIEQTGFGVRFSETESRAQYITKIKQLMQDSVIDRAYKKLIAERLSSFTNLQLETLVATFKEEYKKLGKEV